MMAGSGQHRKADWVAASLVGLPAIVELAMILHHPVPARTIGSAAAIDPFGGIAAVIEANRLFHAVLIMLMLGQLTGLLLLAPRLGLRRALVIAACVFCAIATILLLLATTLDGFVTFELISRCRASASGCGDAARAALAMILASVQAFTKLGLVAQSFGLAAFAGALIQEGRNLRLAGVVGLLIALAPLTLLVSGTYVGPALIMQILAAHALFGMGAALLLGLGCFDGLLATADRHEMSPPAG
jgi:hypothetical protein